MVRIDPPSQKIVGLKLTLLSQLKYFLGCAAYAAGCAAYAVGCAQCCYSAQKVNRCTHFCLKIGAKSVQNNNKIGAKIGATPPFHSRLAVVVGARPFGSSLSIS